MTMICCNYDVIVIRSIII